MPVSRKSRVQVDPGLRDPGFKTYRAESVPHIDPQRKQSQASNYERLARDLGQFNSNLQSFGRAVDAANKRAEAKAKKMEAEKKAAEARKKREAAYAARKKSGGGGYRRKGRKGRRTREQWLEEKRAAFEKKYTLENKYGNEVSKEYDAGKLKVIGEADEDPGSDKRVKGLPNETLEAYKDLGEVKKGIGKEFHQQLKAERANEAAEGYKIADQDEHGEPEVVPTGAYTEEVGPKGDKIMVPVTVPKEKRFITEDEIMMEGLKKQAFIDSTMGSHPLVRRHSKFLNFQNTQARIAGLKDAERQDRHHQALKFQENTVVEEIKKGQELGLNPDQIAQMAISTGLQNAQIVSPETTKEHIIKTTIGTLAKTLKDPNVDLDTVRSVMAFAQGSPDAGVGVTSWLKHPKYQKKVGALVKLASKVYARETSKEIAAAEVKKYMAARADGKMPTAFQDITFPVNGETHTVTAAEQQVILSETVANKALYLNGKDGQMYPEEEHIPRLVAAFKDFPFQRSEHFAKIFKAFHVNIGEQMHPQDPNFKRARALAVEMLNQGPEGLEMIRQYFGNKHMPKFWEMAYALERSGPLSDEDVIQKLNVYLDHRNTRANVKLPKSQYAIAKGWQPDYLDKEERDRAIEVAKADTLDEEVSDSEFETRLEQIGQRLRTFNPEFNGHKFNARGLTVPVRAFSMALEAGFPRITKDFGLEGDFHIQATGNGMFKIVDKKGDIQIIKKGPLAGRPAFLKQETIMTVGKDAVDREALVAGKEKSRIRDRTWFGWAAENLGWDDYDYVPHEQAADRQRTEAGELEKIAKEHPNAMSDRGM